MKKILVLLLSLTAVNAALAESELDKGLKSLDIVDDNYIYTDLDLATGFFAAITENQAKSLPLSFNRLVEINGFMITPYYSYANYRYMIPLDAAERVKVKESLASEQNLREVCEDSFYADKFMKANDFTMVYSYVDIDYRALVNLTVNNANCDAVLAR